MVFYLVRPLDYYQPALQFVIAFIVVPDRLTPTWGLKHMSNIFPTQKIGKVSPSGQLFGEPGTF